MKDKSKYIVTFKNSYDKLVCMFAKKYSSAIDAKHAIEMDADVWLTNHLVRDLSPKAKKCRQSYRWVKPKTEDYFEAKAQDGSVCIYQYFKI